MSRASTAARARSQGRNKANVNANFRVSAPAGPFLSAKFQIAILSILLAGITIGLYSPVFGSSFAGLDDNEYVTENTHVQGGMAWSTVKWAFTSFYAANWHPLTWLSHALDYQLFALNPAGHHLDSVLIHALNVVILFLLLAWVTKRIGPSLLVAALFAVHPLNVESVAWVAERKNVLSTLFFFLAIAAYVRYVQKPGWPRYLLVAGLFAAGLMAKPMVITLPFVLLLLDYWPLERTPKAEEQTGSSSDHGFPRMTFAQLLLEKVPLLLLSAASAWITVVASGHALGSTHQYPLTLRIENAIVAYGQYLWRAVWPASLAALYPYPALALPAWRWILSAAVLIIVTTLVLLFRSRRYLPVGWFWFLGTLIPVIGLVQVGFAAMADRYAYVPLIGIFVMIAWGLDDWAQAKKVGAVWRLIPALCAVLALSFATLAQVRCWENKYTLWSHALTVTEQNSFAHEALAAALLEPELAATAARDGFDTAQKRFDEARRHRELALSIDRQLARQNPDAYLHQLAVTLNELGIQDEKQNRADDARRYYEEALQCYRQLAQQDPVAYLPNVAMTLNNLANVDRLQNRADDARQHLQAALGSYQQLAPQSQAAYLPERAAMLDKLGIMDRLENRIDDARSHYEEALKIRRLLAQQSPTYLPDLARTLSNFGLLDAIQNRTDEARQHYEEALKIQSQIEAQHLAIYLPDLAMAQANLGNLDRQQNRMDEARQQFEAAIRTYRQLAQQSPAYLPHMATTLNNLGDVDLQQGRTDDARAAYQECLAIFGKLAQGDRQFAGDAGRVQARLEQLETQSPRPAGQIK
jgi:protein O-mannosyl-transferase